MAAASKNRASAASDRAASRSVVQRATPLAVASILSRSAFRPTRIGSGRTRSPSASRRPPSARIARSARRCWPVARPPVAPLTMIPKRRSAIVFSCSGPVCRLSSFRSESFAAIENARRNPRIMGEVGPLTLTIDTTTPWLCPASSLAGMRDAAGGLLRRSRHCSADAEETVQNLRWGGGARWRHHDRESGADASVPQPDIVCPCVPARDTGIGVRCA